MRYLINRWDAWQSGGVTCMFSTDSLEAWLKAIAEIKKRYNLTEDCCRWLQNTDQSGKKTAVFSFWHTWGKEGWEGITYLKKPDFIFNGFPEGVKYYE